MSEGQLTGEKPKNFSGKIERQVGNQTVGEVNVTIEDRIDRGGLVAFLRGLVVKDEHRRQGHGGALLDEAIQSSAVPIQQVEVFASNNGALKLYEKKGFKIIDERSLPNGDRLLTMERRNK